MILVDGVQVPVVWRPSDLAGPDSDGEIGRRGQVIRAGVNHRAVGYLESMTNTTFAPTADPLLLPGERRVSSNFGIGFWGDELRIVQYVALENTAYCNGQTEGDIVALLSTRPWSVYSAVRRLAGRHVSANYFTYSIEHEDNAKAGGYVVREEIIAASIALHRLLLLGDGKAIRAAGIRCNDVAAAQLGRIVPGPDTIVDHYRCAPVSKPYCWRRVRNPGGGYYPDLGFPQARYLAALSAPAPIPEEDAMPGLRFTLDATRDDPPPGAIGTAVVKDAGASAIRVRGMVLVGLPKGTPLGTVQTGVLDPPLEAQRGKPVWPGDRSTMVAFNMSGEAFVMLASNVAFEPFSDPTPHSDEDLQAAGRSARLIALQDAAEASSKAIAQLPR